MPCSVQAAQQLTSTSLASICGVPLTQSNFFIPLSTDLNNIKTQAFMDDGSSCSRLIAPDKTDLFVSSAVSTTTTNIGSINIGSVPYPSRLIITGSITDVMGVGVGTSGKTAVVHISTGNYFSSPGAVVVTSKNFYKGLPDGTSQTDNGFISYTLDIAANANPTLYFAGLSNIITGHTIDLDIQVIRVHQ